MPRHTPSTVALVGAVELLTAAGVVESGDGTRRDRRDDGRVRRRGRRGGSARVRGDRERDPGRRGDEDHHRPRDQRRPAPVPGSRRPAGEGARRPHWRVRPHGPRRGHRARWGDRSRRGHRPHRHGLARPVSRPAWYRRRPSRAASRPRRARRASGSGASASAGNPRSRESRTAGPARRAAALPRPAPGEATRAPAARRRAGRAARPGWAGRPGPWPGRRSISARNAPGTPLRSGCRAPPGSAAPPTGRPERDGARRRAAPRRARTCPPRADRAAVGLLGGEVAGSADVHPGLGQRGPVHGPGDTEVDHPRPVLGHDMLAGFRSRCTSRPGGSPAAPRPARRARRQHRRPRRQRPTLGDRLGQRRPRHVGGGQPRRAAVGIRVDHRRGE